ncbi:MAG: hypothetical protein M3277_08515, partial [Actinomycetota bacterium]|nr:hypothetical protein [Actinomycetota bacterium]
MKSFGALALTAAALAAVAVPGHELGLNVALVWIVMAISVWSAVHKGLDDQDSVLFGLAIVPVCLAVVRSAGWVVGLQLVAAVGSMSV